MHFYPRPPRGGRRRTVNTEANPHEIFIHALREEGDWLRRPPCGWSRYFYPRPPRGGRRAGPARLIDLLGISIHALREGRPVVKMHKILRLEKFLSTPSAREGDSIQRPAKETGHNFLSTPSARRATLEPVRVSIPPGFLSTPSARGATCTAMSSVGCRNFLSTPSARRATRPCRRRRCSTVDFIHALREEGDTRISVYAL